MFEISIPHSFSLMGPSRSVPARLPVLIFHFRLSLCHLVPVPFFGGILLLLFWIAYHRTNCVLIIMRIGIEKVGHLRHIR